MFISTKRCTLVSGKSKFLQFSGSILVDLYTNELRTEVLKPVTKSGSTNKYLLWLRDSTKLLKSVNEKSDKDLESELRKSHFFFYSPLTSELEKITTPGTSIGLCIDYHRIPLLFGVDEHTSAYGWINFWGWEHH